MNVQGQPVEFMELHAPYVNNLSCTDGEKSAIKSALILAFVTGHRCAYEAASEILVAKDKVAADRFKAIGNDVAEICSATSKAMRKINP